MDVWSIINNSPLIYIPVMIVIYEITAYEIEKEIKKNSRKIAKIFKKMLSS